MNSNYNDTKKLEEAFAKAVGGAGIEETPEETEVRTVIDLNIAMDAEAMQLVGNYVWEHLDRSDEEPKIEIYVDGDNLVGGDASEVGVWIREVCEDLLPDRRHQV